MMECFIDAKAVSSDTVNVEVYGDINISSASKLKNSLVHLIEQGYHHQVINLNKVKFMDSSGLNPLLFTLKRAREANGSVELVCTKPPIRRIFELTGLAKMFQFVPGADPLSHPSVPNPVAR